MGEPTDSTAATLAEDQVVVLDEGHEQLGLGARLGTDLYHNPLILVPAELFYRAAFAIDRSGPVAGPVFRGVRADGSASAEARKCSNCGKDVKPQAINCGACGHSLLGQAIRSEQPGWRSLMANEIPRVRVRGSIFQGFRRNPNSFTASTLAIAVFVLLLIEWVYPTRLITPGYALLLGVITVGLGMLLAGPRGWGIACLVLGGLLVATSILPFAVEVRTPHVHEPISPPSGFGFEMVKGANPAIHEYRATAYDGRPDAADQAEPRVMAYYLTELQSAGWKLVNHSAIAGYHRADFTKTGRGSIEVIVHEGFPNSGHHVLTLILDVEAVSCAGRTCVVPE